MARNMNTSTFLSDYSLNAMPTPPWKTNTSTVNNFPIPPRNDLVILPKSTNFEWNKSSNNQIIFPPDRNIVVQGGNLVGQPGGYGGPDNRLGTQSHGFSDTGSIGMSGNDLNRSGGNLFIGAGNMFDNRNSGISDGPSMFDGGQHAIRSDPPRDGFGSTVGGFNDNLGNKFSNNQSVGNIHDRNGPNTADGNFDRGNFDRGGNHDRGHNFNRGDNFDRGNNYEIGNNLSRGDSFNQSSNTDRGGNIGNLNQTGINDRRGNFDTAQKGTDSSPIPPWKSQNNDNRNNTNTSNDNRNNQNRRHDSSPQRRDRNDQDSNRRRTRQSVGNNDISRNQPKQTNQTKPLPNISKAPLKNPVQEEDLELEKRALGTDVTMDFFNKIKPLSLMQVAADVALRYARKEYYLSKGNNQKVPDKPTGSGQYTCKTCFVNFLTKEKLNTHNNGIQHKELEDLYLVKKEQARLIIAKKILGPTRPKLEMIQISRAEVENNLKPAEMELDVYILGIYESVMKPYWPLPKSKFYCRVCNYAEFNSESELKRHNLTVDHKKRETTYEEAFCLYCQQHYNDKANLEKHVTTGQHHKIKDLMERTKECAVEHWHKVNNLDIPEKFAASKSDDSQDKEIDIRVPESPRVGSKRSASDNDENKSPMKKPTTSKFDHSTSKADSLKSDTSSKSDSKNDSRKSDKDKIDKGSDKKPTEKKPASKSDTKANSRDARDKKEDSKSISKPDAKPAPKSDAKPAPKSDAKPAPKSDTKSTPKADPKPVPKSDTKSAPKGDTKPGTKSESKPVPKSDAKDSSKSDTKTEPKSDGKIATKSDSKQAADAKVDPKEKNSENEKVWFAPINGFMCIACHVFIADEAGQKTHTSESSHTENVAKLKKMVTQWK